MTSLDPTFRPLPVAIEAKANGIKLYHATCHHCSSFGMVLNGTCKVCLDCGILT